MLLGGTCRGAAPPAPKGPTVHFLRPYADGHRHRGDPRPRPRRVRHRRAVAAPPAARARPRRPSPSRSSTSTAPPRSRPSPSGSSWSAWSSRTRCWRWASCRSPPPSGSADTPARSGPGRQDELGSAAKPEVLTNTDGIKFEKVAALRPDLIVGLYSEPDRRGLRHPVEDRADASPSPRTPSTTASPGSRPPASSAPPSAARTRPRRSSPTSRPSSPPPRPPTRSSPGATALIATQWEGYYVYGAQDPRGRLLQDLGFKLPDGPGRDHRQGVRREHQPRAHRPARHRRADLAGRQVRRRQGQDPRRPAVRQARRQDPGPRRLPGERASCSAAPPRSSPR